MSYEWSESDREGEISHDFPYVWNRKWNYTNELAYKTEMDSQTANELVVVGEEEVVKDFWMDTYTWLYLKWVTSIFYSTGNSDQCYVAAWMGGEFGEECSLVAKSCPTLLQPHGSCLWDSPGKNIGEGCHFLLWGIVLTQEYPCLLHRQVNSLPLSHQGSSWGRMDSRICVADWVPSLFTWNYHNIVNSLYPNTKWKAQKEINLQGQFPIWLQ